jgi:hypothetical protein
MAEATATISGNADPQIQQEILANIQAIGLANFPEDEASVWHVDRIEQTADGKILVETRPVPDVGYAKIRFHMSNTSVQGVVSADHGDYGSDTGWTELFDS